MQGLTRNVRFFKERQNHLRVLSREEEERYLATASPLLRHIATIMLETGMRPGEIDKPGQDDLDLSLGSVFVCPGGIENATRYIPLTQRALRILANRLQAATSEWLFPCPFDELKPVKNVRRAHDASVAWSGIIPRFRRYDLRHTALSRLAMAGIDLPTLNGIAGHSQIQMTMRYVHPTPEHKRRSVLKFEELSRELVAESAKELSAKCIGDDSSR